MSNTDECCRIWVIEERFRNGRWRPIRSQAFWNCRDAYVALRDYRKIMRLTKLCEYRVAKYSRGHAHA